MKYRIRKTTLANGDVYYTPEYSHRVLWVDYWDSLLTGANSPCKSLGSAETILNEFKGRQIAHEEIIDLMANLPAETAEL